MQFFLIFHTFQKDIFFYVSDSNPIFLYQTSTELNKSHFEHTDNRRATDVPKVADVGTD